ncbi:porin family protein [uncultured Bacteroides sp.]|uniref:porin family protein n=1 Tax=uncultured Bacteroides sp. TaxID=162156 RepID=UPI002AAC26E1|nr:porin family protein [uncultured Bacteroides sp.]
MKKIFSIFLVAVCLFIATPMQAQIKLGVKGGVNLANADFSGLKSNFKTENMNGFFIGPMVDINIPIVGLGLDGALLYAEKGTKFTYSNETISNETTNKQKTIEVPVNLKYSIGLGSLASIFLAAGPNFSFDINSDNLTNDLLDITNQTISETTPSINRKNAEVSLNIGGGVKLIKHLQLGINYNLPLTDSAKENFAKGNLGELTNVISGTSFKSKTKVWQVSVAYIF